MVLRSSGWRIVTLVAAGFAAASALPGLPLAQNFPETTGSLAPPPQGGLVWGGHVPPPPREGEAPVYVPSPAFGERGYETPNQSSFRGPQPTPPQFLPPLDMPVAAAPAPLPPATMAPAPLPPLAPAASAPLPPLVPAAPGPGDYGRTYPVAPAPSASAPLPPLPNVQQASLPPLGPGQIIDDSSPGGLYGSTQEDDPWDGLTDPTPDAEIPGPAQAPAPAITVAPPMAAPSASVPSYAALERVRPAPAQERGWSWNPFRWGRGSLESRTPSGYRALPRQEAECRRALTRLGVQFTEVDPIARGNSCGIANPVRVTHAAEGIAMQPAATLSCQTALQTARWLDDEVRPAARWTLWKRPTAVINASSYRCSRIAGSRTISEHALGNALDISGFRFADGSSFSVEPKGVFSPRERSFQQKVRTAGCKYFGTVLGPGYNRAHDDHFHFDVKSRMRPVCK